MSTSKNPTVTVIMSAYREPIEWLKESIESILNQRFKDFEFIIVLDEPNNHEAEKIILEYATKDPRIIFIKNNANIGLTESLNKALKIARGKYIARMDADDIALEYRLEKQVNFLDKNKNISLVSSWVYRIDEYGNVFGCITPPNLDKKNLEKVLLSGYNIFCHPTWMARRELYEHLKGYRLKYAEDYDFILRAIDSGFNLYIMPEFLLKWRISQQKISVRKALLQYKTMLYAITLKKQRAKYGKDLFTEDKYYKFLKSSKLTENLYNLSTKYFVKANNYKSRKKYLFFVLTLLFSLIISPLQAKRFFKLLYGKFILLKFQKGYTTSYVE